MTTPTQSQPPAAGEAAHTPTPWFHTETDIHTAPDDVSSVGWGIATANGFHRDRTSETRRANAAFIVRCVNSHAALVEALEAFAAVADEYDKNCLDECRPEWNEANDDATEMLTGRGGKPLLSLRHFKQARAALNLAQS